MLSRAMSWRCAAWAAVCQRRWLASLARPPAAATRRASDGVRRTTIIRCPTGTSGRGPPTRPRHETGSSPALSEEPPVAAATEIAAAASATIASRPSWASRLGEGVESKVTRVGDRLDEPGGRGDHRGVVGAELERRLRGVRERGTELGVRRHAADDGNPLRAGRLGGLLRSLDERTDDRALVGRSEVGTPMLGLLLRRGREPCRAAPS